MDIFGSLFAHPLSLAGNGGYAPISGDQARQMEMANAEAMRNVAHDPAYLARICAGMQNWRPPEKPVGRGERLAAMGIREIFV